VEIKGLNWSLRGVVILDSCHTLDAMPAAIATPNAVASAILVRTKQNNHVIWKLIYLHTGTYTQWLLEGQTASVQRDHWLSFLHQLLIVLVEHHNPPTCTSQSAYHRLQSTFHVTKHTSHVLRHTPSKAALAMWLLLVLCVSPVIILYMNKLSNIKLCYSNSMSPVHVSQNVVHKYITNAAWIQPWNRLQFWCWIKIMGNLKQVKTTIKNILAWLHNAMNNITQKSLCMCQQNHK